MIVHLKTARLSGPLTCALGALSLSFAATTVVLGTTATRAQGNAAAASAPPSLLAIELNKLEASEKGCRAYVVVDNPGASAFQSVMLDLVLFQPDGVIGRRFSVDLAPLKPAKKTVKLFEIEGVACDRVASVLVNDVMECKTDSGAVSDCLTRMAFTSVAAAKLSTR